MAESAPSMAEVLAPIPKPEAKAPEAAPKTEAPASESTKDPLTGVAAEAPKTESDSKDKDVSEKTIDDTKTADASMEPKTGKATWKNKDHDVPVTVTGSLGKGKDGREYVSVEGSSSGVPLDEVTFPEITTDEVKAEDEKTADEAVIETEELNASEEDTTESYDADDTEDSKDKKRRTQALVRKIEKFQDKYPRLGFREIARVETDENRKARIRETFSGLTNDESYNELLAELKTVHPEQGLETLDKLLKKNLTSSILKKSGRKDLKVIENMLKDPDSYPEIKKLQGNLESMLPVEMKSRNTKKVKKAVGVLIFGLFADLLGQVSKETSQ